MKENREYATFGGGCFWCIEAQLNLIDGITKVTSGYSGGHTENPSYREVCSGNTGHAEVVQVEYNPDKIKYTDLLALFFLAHDPTQLNRQGNDIGTQYRSIILYHNEEQKEAIQRVIETFKAMVDAPIVTEVKALEKFYPAEEEHFNYYSRNPEQGYCKLVIAPKLAEFKNKIENLL